MAKYARLRSLSGSEPSFVQRPRAGIFRHIQSITYKWNWNIVCFKSTLIRIYAQSSISHKDKFHWLSHWMLWYPSPWSFHSLLHTRFYVVFPNFRFSLTYLKMEQFSWFLWRIGSTKSSTHEKGIFCMNCEGECRDHEFWTPQMCAFCTNHENWYPRNKTIHRISSFGKDLGGFLPGSEGDIKICLIKKIICHAREIFSVSNTAFHFDVSRTSAQIIFYYTNNERVRSAKLMIEDAGID